MSETSGMLRLNLNDLVRGLVTAVLGSRCHHRGRVLSAELLLFNADWHALTQQAVNAALAAGAGYLLKNLFTNSEGKVFGKIG
jgi:hypothetical protein